MASSASSSTNVPPALLLPLIPCPYCGDRIVSYVARRGQYPGTRFYKCSHHDDGVCDFYEWQPIYAVRPEVAAAIATRGAPFQGPADAPNSAPPSAATVQVAPLADEDLKPVPNAMSESGSCDDDTTKLRTPSVARPSRSAGDQSRQDKIPSLTSRCSVKHAFEVIQGFSEFKRWLVSEMGWAGMLDVPLLQKLNLKFSAWIMSRVDVHSRSIVITDKKVLRFWPQDVSKVFGIPSGPRNVTGRDATIRPDAIEFIKNTLGMNQAGAHSLKAAENFLNREITDDSSKIEKDCFQIAFVIFVMGHILAPSSKYDYATIDFWGALANTDNISQFNWGEYIIQSLLDAVEKYKRDARSHAHTINLFGCHLWLQVFLLDNLDLGIFNKKHDELPRIKAFDQDWLRRLITMASDLRSVESVCYTRAMVGSNEAAAERRDPVIELPSTDNVLPAEPEPEPHTSAHPITPRPIYVAADHTPNHPTQSINIGPIDYSNYLKRQYPKLLADPLTLMLKEHNAKAFSQLHMARTNILTDMFKFTDKLMAHLAQRCVCCQARGFTDCPLVPTNYESGPDDLLRTPVNQKLSGVRLELSDAEDSTTRVSAGSSKRPPLAPDSVVNSKKSRGSVLDLDGLHLPAAAP
ncbi:hypothetical protein QYE76_019833 [Lolium multiflorum]|uniref:GRF-type domain-containing protein n=1 Tax=Lolium multiflorum TaxID=4521 RepID=A0AAD8VQS1_LOLMU|nr:hypothetical protein QYE76_019833 [Lolium multiflorum]